MEVKCGVPQRSCLGPTLFSLYVNDLPAITSFRVRLFDDDTVLLMTSNDLKKLKKTANVEIHEIEKWLLLNKLDGSLLRSNLNERLMHVEQ